MILCTRYTQEYDVETRENILHIDLMSGASGRSLYRKTYRYERMFPRQQELTAHAHDFAREVAELLATHPRRSAVVDFEVLP